MTILNMMLGRKRGGLEQAAIDYAEALALAQIPSLSVLSPEAWAAAPMTSAGLAHEALPNFNYWDPLAARRLRALATRTQARAIICHGNRAIGLALRALKGRVPVIAVAHNYKTLNFKYADHCFAITEHLSQHLRAGGSQVISHIPNMVRLPAVTPRPAYRNPPIIGTMGRLVKKKGFDVYIQALGLLKARGIPFHAVLGGDGEARATLEATIAALELQPQVELIGWIKNKALFFDFIDVFALPSFEEAFGIVLIEAQAHGVPVVATDAEGPREIVRDGIEGHIVPRHNAEALADTLQAMLANEPQARAMGEAARQRVTQEYSPEAMARRLQTALAPYIPSHG